MKNFKNINKKFKGVRELCPAGKDYYLNNLYYKMFPNYLTINSQAMKIGSEFVANISDSVLKTLEAETAQNSIGAEQSAQLNSNKPTVVKKWSGLTQGTDHRPIGIIHYFTSMGQYIKSVMKTTLHKQCHTAYFKSDGSITHAYYWMPTKQEPHVFEFNLMDPNTLDPCLEAFWAEVKKCYDQRMSSMTYDETRIPVQYLTDVVKSRPQSYAEPLF